MVDNNDFEPAKMSPHSQDAEEAVLGSILINPDAYLEVAQIIKKPHEFFILHNGWIWEAMGRLNGRNEIIEYLTIIEELRAQGRLKDAGGAAYITYLASNVATSVYAESYAIIVHRAYLRRGMLKFAAEVADLARNEDSDINEIINKTLDSAMQLAESATTDSDIREIREVVAAVHSNIEAIMNGEKEIHVVMTGFYFLDLLLGGFGESEYITVAARPGMGKTAFLLCIALFAALNGKNVLFFSIEMGAEQLAMRLMAMISTIPYLKQKLGQLNEDELKMFIEGTKIIADLPGRIWVVETAKINALNVHHTIGVYTARYGVDIAIGDYLGLLEDMPSATGKRGQGGDTVQELSKTTRQLKVTAKHYRIPMVFACQLSRNVEQRSDKRPTLPDLRSSGSIEQDSDVVIMLYRHGYYVPEYELPDQAECIVAKNRNGDTKTIYLRWLAGQTMFIDPPGTPHANNL